MSEKEPDGTSYFWLVVVYDDISKTPRCVKCENQPSFEEALRAELLDADQEMYIFAFHGSRIPIGTLHPVGSYVIDGKPVMVSRETSVVDESGHIMPLIPKPKN